jgi:hypothetical protein
MPCFSQREPQQTEEQRRAEVKKALTDIDKLIAKRKIKLKIGPQGAITFLGLEQAQRGRMTDVCIFNRLMQNGSEAVKQALIQAEQMAGRKVSAKALTQGIHSHDGGASWHPRG